MYNTNKPSADDLPSSAQLLKSTVIAMGVAMALLVAVVMPSEYGIDPTGVGKLLGLKEMGEIKTQLAAEAAADERAALTPPARPALAVIAKPAEAATTQAEAPVPEPVAPIAPKAEAPTVETPQPAAAAERVAAAPVKDTAPVPAPVAEQVKTDELSFKLTPGQGAEAKLEMKKGQLVSFRWTGNGGKVNYDTHGDPYDAPRGFYHGYGKGRFTPEAAGDIEAAFDGYHGWFWRNRTKKDVTVTLQVEGDYIALKRVL